MGYRLSKIYTRTGDKGTTGLGDGRRVDKDSARIEAIGTVDELNSLIGVLIAQAIPQSIRDLLTGIQHRLFDLGGELSIPSMQVIKAESVDQLEAFLDQLNGDLPPLKEFVLPGGNPPAAHCHHARTVCRRAERRLTHLSRQQGEEVSANALKYLNRLSDLLFVVGRVLARENGGSEVLWRKGG
ncbi:MAG: cob(I)yrinic acid a,c-diamide adenosyltransferase [Gammaproteobacteria bacterium]|nr:cob(I)yrinic acid a,c-diamide adenosyltransferase [Gammaproteobacteria bacterium]HXK56543.1 cob(I)yrinic acid a,c-diamide adenosyltransferase [Gammaproteobacteria bacterium]